MFHLAANPQHLQGHSSTRGWVQGIQPPGSLSPSPPGSAALGQPLQIPCLERSGSSFAKWDWGLWEAANPAGADGGVPGSC